MQDLIQKLQKIGLKKNEALIYCTLLQKGEQTITELAAVSQLSRPSIYKILKSLRVHELVENPVLHKSSLFKASDPDCIFLILRKRQELFFHLLPALRNLSNVPRGTNH